VVGDGGEQIFDRGGGNKSHGICSYAMTNLKEMTEAVSKHYIGGRKWWSPKTCQYLQLCYDKFKGDDRGGFKALHLWMKMVVSQNLLVFAVML